MNPSRTIRIHGLLMLAGLALTLTVRAEDTARRPELPDIAELVRQLGADDFHKREEASLRLLKIGLPARQALLEGTKDRDLEIRKRCQELIPAIHEAHRQAELAAFIADKEGKHKHDLPGWERYRKIAGAGDDARQLFVDIQKADATLLSEVDKDPARAGARCAQLCQSLINQQQFQRRAGQDVPLPELAPLLLVAADPKVSIPVTHRHLFGQLLYQNAVQKTLRGDRSTPFKKIVLAWMERQAEDETTAQTLFNVINSLQIKEGLDLALKAARGKKLTGTSLAHALVTVGRLGDKQHLSLLEGFLDDKTMFCGFGIGRANGGNVQGNTEVRDVALAMLIRLTKQPFNDYGFALSGLGNDHLMNNANFLGFSSNKERDKAFAKWKAWKASQKK